MRNGIRETNHVREESSPRIGALTEDSRIKAGRKTGRRTHVS